MSKVQVEIQEQSLWHKSLWKGQQLMSEKRLIGKWRFSWRKRHHWKAFINYETQRGIWGGRRKQRWDSWVSNMTKEWMRLINMFICITPLKKRFNMDMQFLNQKLALRTKLTKHMNLFLGRISLKKEKCLKSILLFISVGPRDQFYFAFMDWVFQLWVLRY